MPALSHTTDLYNAGSEALARGNVGEAVLFLRAASRLEPRAHDVARNLTIAEARVALARGESGAGGGGGSPLALSSAEGWILAALLIALGALGMVWRWTRLGRVGPGAAESASRTRGARRVLDAVGIAGLALAGWLLAGAVVERLFPEAIVLERSLPLTAASGQPLPSAPALVEGENVRLGAEREGLVEIKLGGTSVGWARRSGVWRVKDAARYTPPSSREGRDRGVPMGGTHG